MKSLVVLPTYNEIDNLASMVEAILHQVTHINILVVDDNSPDGTGKLADELSQKYVGRLHVLHRSSKGGLGPAYLAGFQWAINQNFDHIIQMDADFSHPIALIPKLLEELQHHDFILASRYVKGGGTHNWGFLRRVISRGGNIYARIILQLGVKDLTGGFKAYHRRVLQFLLASPIQSKGYHFQIETTARAITHGFSFSEVPFVFVERQAGNSKMDKGIFFEAMAQTIKLKWTLKKVSQTSNKNQSSWVA